MSKETIFSRPFTLNRAPSSYILVYGDSSDLAITKLFWSLLVPSDIKIQNTLYIQELKDKSSDALLTVFIIDDSDDQIVLGSDLARNNTLTGDIMGIAPQVETARRVKILASGFDSVFSMDMVQSPDFQRIVQQKIEKARIRQTNRIMQEEYRRFRAALTASPDAFIVLDNERRIFFVSEHYKRAYPALASKLVRGLPVMDAFEIARVEQGVGDKDPRYQPMKKFWQTLQGQIEFTMENGRIWRIKAAPLADGQGTIVTTMDITEIVSQRREIEEKSRLLAEALEKEQEASTLQKQFIGMVSHEFRTPLAIIDGNAQLILRQRVPNIEEAQARCKTICSAVSRLVHMMESVLSSNMLKTGRLDPDPKEFDLKELIKVLCEEQAELARSHKITWDTSGIRGPVCLDPKMMTLILTNLLSNAVKFTKDNPAIHVDAHQDGANIVIRVQDNGIGIPEEERRMIFDRYYRATTSAGIPGTGIGLNLVQNLLALQGGRISVESRVGGGTRFTVHLQNVN